MTILIACILTLLFASTARSRMAAVCSSHQSARSELHCGERNLHQADSLKRFLVSHPEAGTRSDRRRLYRDARWLRRYALSMIHDARARMVPAIPHRAGWECIHRREGAWNANTGNGYFGGLQAHLNWYGVYRMDWLSPDQQMAAAERAYRLNRYSRSWLAGQWPNTYPPCAGLF